ncbi:MAG: DEAD/DEAH box helicase, partial [Wenzhouxiangellaceae bacterium]|nr:DEAD/DEAH box helicase [Wenzhouxiangellaceae bacterium]
MSLFSPEQQLDRWFSHALGHRTAVQRTAWPLLRLGRNAMLIAPTGQGKSLAAWLPLVERMVKDSVPRRGVRALHIAPLKALARDMTVNLAPLLEFAGQLRARPLEMALRCGDTPQSERARQRRRPPEILSTTPESLYVLLGSAGGRRLLATVEAVVVDELHALASSKRGAHLALSLARLDRLTPQPVQRIGLSATARPADSLGAFLCGGAACEIVQPDPPQGVDLRVELPELPLGPFPNTVHWQQIHARIAALAGATGAHTNGVEGPGRSPAPVADPSPGSLLVFCQTRAQVERSAAALDELLAAAGLPGQVGAHHG